jgi:hypothetical protein
MPSSRSGPPGAGFSERPDKAYRGSCKRIRRIKWREQTSVEFWVFVVLVALMLIVGVPWLVWHPMEHQHHAPRNTTVHAKPQ